MNTNMTKSTPSIVNVTDNVYRASVSRRKFLSLAGMTAVGAILCSGTPSLGNNPVQLVYQDWRTDWFPPMIQHMLETFHAVHPNIRVFYTPDPEDFQNRMLADLQTGTAADVFQGCCSHFPLWAQNGDLLDLRPYVEADLDQAIIADWDPAQYNAFFTPDGRQFGLPKYHGALALYYNKDLFDAYHVDYPDYTWNYNDYHEAMKRLTHDRDGDGRTDLWGSMFDITWDRIQVHVNGWGGHLVDPDDPTRLLLCEPEALAAIEWLRARLWDDHVMATPLDVQNMTTRQAFMTGRVAMVEDGSWALKDILVGSDFRIGITPFPAGPMRRATLATTDGFGIYAGTKHPDEAWELLKFLISKEYGRAMAQANFLQPARASLIDDWVGYIRKEFPEKTKDIDIGVFADSHIKGYSVTVEYFHDMADIKWLIDNAWDQILTLGQAPVEQMKNVCLQM